MSVIPPIDPRQMAAEIESTVAEFNRLVNLAGELGLQVEALLSEQQAADRAGPRPLLTVRVIQPF